VVVASPAWLAATSAVQAGFQGGISVSYEQYRASLIQSYYDYQLETLMSDFDPRRPTVILLPGGMGSQLERTEQAYPANPNLITDIVWLDWQVIIGDARTLEIDAAGADKDSFVLAAHGPFKFFGENPYGDLRERARSKNWNYAVFGYDWRRPLKESAAYFKNWILDFRARVRRRFGDAYDPIPRLTIVCHSMGGLVATAALADANFSGLGFNAVMTIATPFYGTSTQQERYYKGVDRLNDIYGTQDVIRIVASLPGPYTLMFLPKAVYDRDQQKLGLTRYPEFDPNGPCDPYDAAMMRRWPQPIRDRWQHIDKARDEMIGVADPINRNIAAKFFNVRSGLDRTTAVELVWNDVDGTTIDPDDDPSPVTGLAGPGDGTVPAWSAFHAYCSNRHDLTQAKDHGNLLRHREVLALIEKVVTTGKLPVRPMAARAGKAPAKETVAKKTDRAFSNLAAQPAAERTMPPELFEKPVQQSFMADLIGGTKPRMVGTASPAAAAVGPQREAVARPKKAKKAKKTASKRKRKR
jgi:pimeloyl-ACP methyl ester carboxylesterase